MKKIKSYLDTQHLNKYTIKAQDGELGHISDFLFDEELFYLRYLVVNTEPFLLRNMVLVSPMNFQKIDPNDRTVYLSITKEALENSPSLDSAETISDQYEKAYHDYFSLPYYWGQESSAWALGPYGVPWGYFDTLGP